jgi:hypothetical protein
VIEKKEEPDLREIVNDAIQVIAKQLKEKAEVKGTVADLLRLLQLRDELAVQKKGKILAGWVSECNPTLIVQ